MLQKRKLLVTLLALVLAFSFTACGGNDDKSTNEKSTKATGSFGKFNEAIDIEFSKGMMEHLSKLGDDKDTGNRSAGSPAEKEAMKYIKKNMEEIGLENVTVDETETDGWTYKGANLTFKNEKGEDQKVILGGYQTTLQAKDEKVKLVYVNQGTAEDYENIDVKDKLVLLELNPDEDWWINYPAYQAKLKGAKAVLAVTVMEEEIDDRINSNDICGPADAPAFGISKKDSDALQKAMEYDYGEIEVTLNADSKVTEDAGSQNVWGEIPGKTDETILFIAHYDGYYHSYYDDAFGVGTILGMAKAFKDSGYKPEKTLRFIAHGAEEWGKTNAETDWAVGSYQQIVKVHPEWAEQAFALINIDSGYMLKGTNSFEVAMPEELKGYMETAIKNFKSDNDVKIKVYDGLPMTGTEDFIYNAMGVLTMSNESVDGDAKYFGSMYHSDKDTLEVGGFEDKTYTTMNEFYGYTAMTMDQMAIKPMNFESRFTAMSESLSDDVDRVEFDKNAEVALKAAKSLDTKAAELNKSYEKALKDKDSDNTKALKKDALKLNKETYKVYKQIQDDFLRLNRWMEYQFPHEGLQSNMELLDKAVKKLEKGDSEGALDELYNIESVYYASAFDKETCDYFLDNLDEGTKGTWAENRLVGEPCDAGDVVRSLIKKGEDKSKDFGLEITALKELISEQKATLQDEVDKESECLAEISGMIEKLL